MKLPILVCHGEPPVVVRYSLVNQNVQSSVGSIANIE